MKCAVLFSFVFLAISSMGAFAQTVADLDPNIYVKQSAAGTLVGYVQNEFIVVLKDGAAIDKTSDAKASVALSSLSGFSALSSTYRVDKLAPQFPGSDKGRATLSVAGRRLARHYKVKFTQGTLEEAMAAYAANPNVDHVEPIGIHVVYATPNDLYYASQWHLNQTSDCDIDAPEAWNVETGDTSIVVAILDTGVRYYHKDIGGVNASYTNKTAARGNMWINWAEQNGTASVDDDGNGYVDDWIGYDFVTGASSCWTGEDCTTKDNDPADFNGHGTHCAGNVGAMNNNGYKTCAASGGWGSGSKTEYGNGVKVMACRVGWSANDSGTEVGYGRTDFFAEGFYYAADNGAKIASLSFGASNSGGLAAAVTYFINEGGLVFKAAGNDGSTTADYLCGRSDVISVAATDRSDCKASFSNYGTWVDISAPGVDIYSLYHSHSSPVTDYVTTMSGTSMATPIAASVAALIWSKNPSWTAAQVKALLYERADNIYGLACNSSYAGKLGAGRVNAGDAVNTIFVLVGSPDGGEEWSVGDHHDILWSTGGPDPDSINIYLSVDSGASFAYTIAHGLAGSSVSYDWTVPEMPMSTARIRVVAYTAEENASDDSDADFTIQGGPYHYVRNGGGNFYPYTTSFWAAAEIQDAVDAAENGDTILVAGGTYASGVTVDKAVYLLGGWDTTFTTRDPEAYPATIQGTGSGISFMNISSELCGIEGFTLTQGTGTSAAMPVSGLYGGGIYSYQSSPTIRSNRIVESGCADDGNFSAGGGIACSGGELVIEYNELENCAAQSGGGIYLYDTYAVIRHNRISGSAPNAAYTGEKAGGGICSYDATATLENNRMENNDGYGKGGGIYAYLGVTTLAEDTISANDCDVAGGGIYSEHAYLGAYHALIVENTCSGGGGGGVYFRAGHISLANSIVALNESAASGGGVYADSVRGSIVNITVDRNRASCGGNVCVNGATSLTFKNNLVTYGSQYGLQAASMNNVTYSYNDCYGNTPQDYDGVVPDTTNISRSPFYADTAAFDYHLLVHSGGIDTGDPSSAADPDGSPADQGAYGGSNGEMAAPEYVKNLAAAVMSDTTIQLTWDQAGDASSYAVYGSQTPGFAPEESVCLGSVAEPVRTFLHEPIGGCWYYRVSAANALGYGGGYSSEADECAVGPDLLPPTVEVVYPNGGEDIAPGDTIEIKWLASDNKQVDSVSIYYSSNAGTDYNLIVQGCTADSTYEWIVPEISSDSCLVRVVAYDPSLNAGVDASDTIFSIRDEATGNDDETMPCISALNQNYPNPFNPSTRISYSIRAADRVSLRIYDITGRLVRVLVDSTEPAGAHEVIWNGKDNAGRSVASGIYFYRVDAGSFSATRKMVLLR